MATVDSPAKDYVRYLRAKLVEAENGLLAMSQKYGAAKSRFDMLCANRGITPETEMVSYQELKKLHPELDYWYSMVEHYQREVAAYGSALSGIEAAQRMLASDGYRRPRPDGNRGLRRDSDAPRRDARPAAGR